MAEYIERKVLRKMMQEKYDKLMQEGNARYNIFSEL